MSGANGVNIGNEMNGFESMEMGGGGVKIMMNWEMKIMMKIIKIRNVSHGKRSEFC